MTALVLPAITSIVPGPAPLKGTCSTSILVTALKFSMPRCSEPPMPPEAYGMSPGFALASAMNSFTVLAGKSGCDCQRVRAGDHHRDRVDAFEQVVLEGVHRGMHGIGDRQDQDVVAVGGRMDHALGGADAAAAGHVLGDELLAELLAQVLRQQAGGDVVDAARRERHQDAHRLVRIVLRRGRRRERERQAAAVSSHERILVIAVASPLSP